MEKEARYYEILPEGNIRCMLCPHRCLISSGKKGLCMGRINKEGKLYSESFGKVSSIGIDPIEKKPLYHFYPGSEILSIGTYGCNFRCDYCQNWEISQQIPPLKYFKPEEIVGIAENNNIIGIAYTYSEPSVWYEFVYETSILANKKKLKNVLVTNGYINPEPLEEIVDNIDAVNIDLKSFNKGFYNRVCGGELDPVLYTIRYLSKKTHLEITTLIIPGLNDSDKELKKLFSFIAEIDDKIPVHLTRYFPRYKRKTPATPLKKMKEAYNLAREYLDYVYIGNVGNEKASNTYCPECNEAVVIREGYYVENRLENNKCPGCGFKIPVRGK